VARDSVRRFLAQDGFFLAAGLSFYVVICVVPFLLLLIAAGGFLLSDEMVIGPILRRLSESLPVHQREIREILTGVVAARGVSGLVGTVILLLFATQVFAATRLVLNRMLGLRGRSLVHGVAFDLAMIVALTVLFFLTIGVTATFAWLRRLAGRGYAIALLFEWAGVFLGIGLDTLLFAVVYAFVPARRMAWPSVLTASVTAGVLWQVAKQLFRLYIEDIDVYSAVYGSLGVTVALIMWVYYSALVFVVGAALIRVLEERRSPGGSTVV
jgi:membrane protein